MAGSATNKDENHKKRLPIDCSQTINRFTLLDALPLLRISDVVNKIALYRILIIDLRSAYHQVPLKEEDKLYTAFEVQGNLYQFTRLSFGVTNGVALFSERDASVLISPIAAVKITSQLTHCPLTVHFLLCSYTEHNSWSAIV